MRAESVRARVVLAVGVGIFAASIAGGQVCVVRPPNVFDVTTSPTQSALSSGQSIFVENAQAYFSAQIPGEGFVIYRTDGTTSGTERYSQPGLPTTSAFGPVSWSGGGLVSLAGNQVYLVTPTGNALIDPAYQRPISRTFDEFVRVGDRVVYLNRQSNGLVSVNGVSFAGGTPSVQTLLTLPTATWRSSPMVAVGSRLVFGIYDNSSLNAARVYATDGTTAGTVELIDTTTGCATGTCTLPGYIDDVFVLNGRAYFAAIRPSAGNPGPWELWSTDGTPAGTSVVPGVMAGYFNGKPRFLGAIGGKVIMYGFTDFAVPVGTTSGLHVYDTAAGAISFVPNLTADPMAADGQRAIDVGGKLIFRGRMVGTSVDLLGYEPWVTDGTIAGTLRLVDVNTGGSDGLPSTLQSQGVVVNAKGVFAAQGATSLELWASDGTPGGTVRILEGLTGASTLRIASVGARGYFANTSTGEGSELWVTDGTATGTRLFADLSPGLASSSPAGFAVLGSGVVFHAVDPSAGREIFSADETGARLLLDIAGGSVSSTTLGLVKVGSLAGVFAGSSVTASTGGYLWDGSRVNPARAFGPPDVALSSAIPVTDAPGLGTFYASGGNLFIAAPGFGSVTRLTGMPANTIALRSSSATVGGTLIGSNLIFGDASVNGSGLELFISDGTPAGTALLKDIAPGADSSQPSRFVSLGTRAVFFARTNQTGEEPWSTDGTLAGTVALGDLFPGTTSSTQINPDQSPLLPAVFAGQAFFAARTSSTQTRMYLTDGTPAGTRAVDTGGVTPLGLLSASDAGVYFVGTGPLGSELYATDGSLGGTRLVADVTPGPTSTTWSFVTGAGARVFFAALLTNPNRAQLYVTDSTPAGFSPLPWPVAGETPGSFNSIGIVRGKLLYLALIGTTYRLAISDGTPAGTCVIGPWNGLGPRTTGWQPVIVNSRVFAAVTDPVFGREPASWNLCPADFNNSGGALTVQDVFDFLSAFFAGDPRADFNASGGTPTTQDVFDFLAAWFAGCS